MSTRAYCIIDKYRDLESGFNAGYTGCKFDVRGYHCNSTCSFDVTLQEDMVIKHPIDASFENVSNHILLHVHDTKRKFLITAMLMYKPLPGNVYILSTPPILMQTPSQTLDLMKHQLNTLLVLNETTDNEMRTLERQIQQTHRLEQAQNALVHSRQIIASNVPTVCPGCLREDKRVACLRCNKPSVCSTCFVRNVRCYLCR